MELKKNSSLYRKLKARLKELITQGSYHKQLSDENFDKYVRAMADFDNYRKRVAKEYLEKEAEANRNLIAKLLPVLDNLDRAIEVSRNGAENDEALKSFHQGIQLIDQQIHNVLENEGLKPFSSKGEEFDPARHDAVLSVETAEHEPNKVLDEVEKGFVFKGKVLRHARVTVSKRPGGEPEEPAEEYPEESAENESQEPTE
ncbi:MAG: nucleotide exchange factor GrpE [Candidatus Edwardsbacteria bacterium]|nr:nucleotide exchange factor GrpE [Candidatus Edwardsbacteria bacterium]MBU1577642.1 nucleotide exchange factor GrpE [Candidatus Edwardsbacteria bacterium]MBU2463009.1 nucleotide exchange factor GrpE [Candidatus Edwardsbacteria bacterium]MBU2592949.1 nucleotide exchange factor GrpE [Candidatus Edwardsbacteria bacterium]